MSVQEDKLREQRWVELYEELTSLMSKFGSENASGDGDYWVVDDDWGGRHQKICVTRHGFWSEKIREHVQQLLARSFPDWGIFVVFEPSANEQRDPFVVYADGVAKTPRWE